MRKTCRENGIRCGINGMAFSTPVGCAPGVIAADPSELPLCGSEVTDVAKKQRFPNISGFVSRDYLTVTERAAKVCDVSHTVQSGAHGTKMNYLSNVANQRPRLHVTRDILLAFGFATPLLLLLFFLL